MRTLLATAMVLGIAGLSSNFAPVSAEPPAFHVPRVAPDRAPEAAPIHEVVLPADVVMRPGESPREALARALHPQTTEPSRESK